MASLTQQLVGLKCPPVSTTRLQSKKLLVNHQQKPRIVVAQAAAVVANAQTRERLKLKEMFEDAYDRCRTTPMDGVAFTIDDFHSALEKYDFDSEVGTKVKGTVFSVDANGALVDITAKSSAYLPLREASLHNIKHVEEAGIFPGLREEFVVVGENEADDSLVLSLRSIQYDLAWERCRQLQAEDVVIKGKVVGANKGGVVALVEGLRGFVPFSQISTKSTAEELLEKELPLKFVEVDEEQSRLVLSNRKAMADSQAQLGIGSVVLGTVQSLKPYGAFIDIGGINGLLHVMILSHDRERGRVSLSTKKLEPTPGDMIRNPKLVFEKAEEMAQTFRQRIAQAEAMARADMLRFQPEHVSILYLMERSEQDIFRADQSGLTLSSDGILGPLTSELPEDGLDLSEIPPAEDL
ncbi:hypothetical protein RND71_002015 [Anisodus tanguticus]|uniref:S1 motif domain-containing protein n=1 Tax=Anisodus tanguticus TaxID=243964 RepID=A0AAE1VRK7_9SOLA|nr:hypothetical protein RND71_002015 [Anisodus tanguticus]